MRIPVVVVALIICVSTAAAGQSPDSTPVVRPTPTRDALFGLDKPKHFFLSAFIESASFAAFQAGGASYKSSMAGGVASVSVFAIGREIHDRRTKGLFSFGDLVWDALGAGAAAVMLHNTYR